MKLLKKLNLLIHDVIWQNRIRIKPGNVLSIGYAERLRLKKVSIHVKGSGNSVSVGSGTMINNCKIRVDGSNQRLIIGERCLYHAGKIYLRFNSGQFIRIGDGTTIEDAYLLTDEDASIEIGKDCMFSKLVHLRAGDGHSVLDAVSGMRINRAKDIVLGDHIWVGRGATLLKGAKVADNSIIGAYAVVTKVFASQGCAIAGNPAKIVREGVTWDRRML